MLSWDDFRYIKAIAETRSLNGAAQTLNVNHSTVFRRLGQVEKQLGSRLFDRGRAGYVLTPCGEEMVRLAERIGDDVTSFERRVTGQDLRPSGELRVTSNDLVLLHLLTEVLVDFRKAYPEIVLDIVVSNTMLNLSRRDADVAVRAAYHPPETLSGRRVSKIAWAVYGPASRKIKSFHPRRDAPKYDWVGFADHIAIAKVTKWLKTHVDGADRMVYKVNTMLGLAEAVAGGAGLALLPVLRRPIRVRPEPVDAAIVRARRRALARHASRLERDRARARIRRLLLDGGRQAPEDYGRPRLTVAVSCRAMLPRRRGSKAAATAAASCAPPMVCADRGG